MLLAELLALLRPNMTEVAAIPAPDPLADVHCAIEKQQTLAAVDLALQFLNTHGDEKIRKRAFRQMCRAALAHMGRQLSEAERAVEVIFDPGLPPKSQRFIAICLLRSLAYDPDIFMDLTIRNKTFISFDNALQDIYKNAKTDVKKQTHEKEVALRS